MKERRDQSDVASSSGTTSGALRCCPLCSGMSDRSGTVCNCVSMMRFSASPDVERWANPTVAVMSRSRYV